MYFIQISLLSLGFDISGWCAVCECCKL